MIQSNTPEEMLGISRLPRVERKEDLLNALARHYPADLRARGAVGSVLVDVLLDAAGEVRDVRAVHRDAVSTHGAVLGHGDQARAAPAVDGNASDGRFAEAASAALREVRFTAALRENVPVPFTIRMTVVFDHHLPNL